MSRYVEYDSLIADSYESDMWDRGTQRFNLRVVEVDDIEKAPSIDLVRRKPVVGYEGYYEVDMYGNVYSVERTVKVNDNGRIYGKPVKSKKLSETKHSAGYRTVTLTRNGEMVNKYVHRIVAEAYIPNPQNLSCVNHKDEDKTNNFVGNLEWCTVQYNTNYGNAREKQADALRGRKHSQEHRDKNRQGNLGKHGKQKKVICLDDGKVFDSYNEAGKYYGMHYQTVKSCCERKSQGKMRTFRYYDDFCSYGERKESE